MKNVIVDYCLSTQKEVVSSSGGLLAWTLDRGLLQLSKGGKCTLKAEDLQMHSRSLSARRKTGAPADINLSALIQKRSCEVKQSIFANKEGLLERKTGVLRNI